MPLATIGNLRDLVEIIVTAISLLGGAMAYASGWAALRAVNVAAPPEELARRVNEGLAVGFLYGWPLAVFVAILLASI